MVTNCFTKNWAIGGNELYNVIWESTLPQNLVDHIVRQYGRVRRFPKNRISHHGRGARQIAPNGSEVKGRNGGDKTFARAVMNLVGDAHIGT